MFSISLRETASPPPNEWNRYFILYIAVYKVDLETQVILGVAQKYRNGNEQDRDVKRKDGGKEKRRPRERERALLNQLLHHYHL